MMAKVSGFPWSTMRSRALAAGAAVGAPELEGFRKSGDVKKPNLQWVAVPCRGRAVRVAQGIAAAFRAAGPEFVASGFLC